MDDRKKEPRKRLRLVKKDSKPSDVLERQVIEEDYFESSYAEYNLLQPPYRFDKLKQIAGSSDAILSCIDARTQNIDGFGYKLVYMGEDKAQKDKPEAKKNKVLLESFFNQANENQSFTAVKKMVRGDMETIGNGAYEIVRGNDGEIMMMYYAPFEHIRCTRLSEPVEVEVTIKRGDKILTGVRVRKRFRKYAQMLNGKRLRWFRELGDPRPMDAVTGEYLPEGSVGMATEILHMKLIATSDAYSLPIWIPSVFAAKGRTSAQYVNYTTFEEGGGIPPMVVMISGNGRLTQESIDDLDTVFAPRTAEDWHRIAILEVESEDVGLDGEGNSTRIDLKNTGESRPNDVTFGSYMKQAEEDIQHRYRLPPIYLGAASSYTLATSKASNIVAEQQIFNPERASSDEIVNLRLVKSEFGIYDWEYRSKGPKIVGAEDIAMEVTSFAEKGGMSMNQVIERANEAFGLEMSLFEEKWASYPVPVVMELLKQGKLDGIDEIIKEIVVPINDKLPPAPPEDDVEEIEEEEEITLIEKTLQRLEKGGYLKPHEGCTHDTEEEGSDETSRAGC